MLGFIAGMKLALPEGFTRTVDNITEEVEIPVSEPAPPEVGGKLFPISQMDEVNICVCLSR